MHPQYLNNLLVHTASYTWTNAMKTDTNFKVIIMEDVFEIITNLLYRKAMNSTSSGLHCKWWEMIWNKDLLIIELIIMLYTLWCTFSQCHKCWRNRFQDGNKKIERHIQITSTEKVSFSPLIVVPKPLQDRHIFQLWQ